MLNLDRLETEWNNSKQHRPKIRGMMGIQMDFLRRKEEVSNVLEFGIAGGGAHEKFRVAGADIVAGIELWHPDPEVTTQADTHGVLGDHNTWVQAYKFLQESTISQDKDNVYRFLHGLDQFDPTAPEKIREKSGVDKWDLIVDDGCPDSNVQKPLIPLWGRHLTPTGLLFSNCPNGYGVTTAWETPWKQHMEMFKYHATNGMVIFNTNPWVDWEHFGSPRIIGHNFFGIYTPNKEFYKDVFDKYSDHIVIGEY